MSITATTAQQHELLGLQSLDSQLARLRTQLSDIRHDEQLTKLRHDGTVAVQNAKTVETRVAEQQAAAQQAEQVVQETTKRRDGLQSRMDADDVPSRDVQAVSMQIAELTIRIGQLEETELQAMQTLQDAQAALELAQAQIVEAEQAVNVRIQTLNERGQQLSKQGKELTAERAVVAEKLPADLLAEYEDIREQNHGVGAMELAADGLSGGGVPISPAELSVIKQTPENELTYCPDTGAILVRN